MSGMARNGVRGTKETHRTSDSSSTSSMGRLVEKFSGLKTKMKKAQGRSDSGDDEDDGRVFAGTEVTCRDDTDSSISLDLLTVSDSIASDEDDQSHRKFMRNIRRQCQQQCPVKKGKLVMRDTSGNTDVSSSTASATSDSECDDSFDVNDHPTGSRRVQFSNVSMRTYSLVLGETQASKSYPISLDWAHTPTKTIDITLFELLYSASRKSECLNKQGKMVRGFRIPRRLRSAQRLELLSNVTGQKPEELYETNLARITRELEYIPATACCSDDGYVELREKAYQLIDSDEYVQVVI